MMHSPIQEGRERSEIKEGKDSFHRQIGLKFKEEDNKSVTFLV